MKYRIIFFLLFLFALNSYSQVVKFEIENAGLTVQGSFKISSNEILYNEQIPSKSKFISVIAVNSISTGIGLRDEHLMKESYFNQKKYPFIKFISNEVKLLPNNRLLIKGDLTIKDVTNSVTLEVLMTKVSNGHQFTFKLPINRRDYHVGGKSLTMSDIAFVMVDVTVTK